MASITDGPKVPISKHSKVKLFKLQWILTKPRVTANWFDYDPLLAPAVVFGILYAVAFAVTAFQFFRYKSWFWVCMVVGALSKLMCEGRISRLRLTVTSGGSWIRCAHLLGG